MTQATAQGSATTVDTVEAVRELGDDCIDTIDYLDLADWQPARPVCARDNKVGVSKDRTVSSEGVSNQAAVPP